MPAPQSRQWCFTINNPTEEDYHALQNPPNGVTYYVYQLELAPTTGTPHLQGYVQLSRRVTRFKLVKTWLKRANAEVTRGTPVEARTYCMKEDSRAPGAQPVEYGDFDDTMNHQGQRNDLLEIKRKLEHGASMSQIADEHFGSWLRYREGFATYKRLRMTLDSYRYSLDDFVVPPMDLTKANLLVGPSGIGKTEFALAHFKNPLMVTHMDHLRVFDKGTHDGIVFDDMAFAHLPPETLIHLTDMEHGRQIHCRYEPAFIPARIPRVFTTNNYSSVVSSNFPEEQLPAVERRLITHYLFNDLRKPPLGGGAQWGGTIGEANASPPRGGAQRGALVAEPRNLC